MDMFDWIKDVSSRLNSFADDKGGILARVLGFLSLMLALAFAIIAYKEFSSM